MRRLTRILCVTALVTALSGCSGTDTTGDQPPIADEPVQSAAVVASTVSSDTTPPGELVTGKPCEEVTGAVEEIASQAAATVPLVVGLALGHTWIGAKKGENDYEHECLTQVAAIDSSGVLLKHRCSSRNDDDTRVLNRVTNCHTDLRDGSIFRTEFGAQVPEFIAGSTLAVVSQRMFRELRTQGKTRFRQVHVLASMWQKGAEAADPESNVYTTEDVVGTLERTERGAFTVQVNDSLMALPAIVADIVLHDVKGQANDQHQRMIVLDDERFPIVLDIQRAATAAGLRLNRITWPRQSAIEQKLAKAGTTDVYGIFFDYNSAEIRVESELVLQEIARALQSHADWTLSIVGHTDSIGGTSFNGPLSEKRAEAVRAALVDRYGVSAARLTSSGAGASRPVDTNGTPDGRSRNRRVELVRSGVR